MTHFTECWREHGIDCARAEIARLRDSVASLEQILSVTRDALAETKRHRGLLADQLAELQHLAEHHDRPRLTTFTNGATT